MFIKLQADRRHARNAAFEGPGDRRKGLVDRRKSLRYLGLGALCLGLAAPASAQIYSWRDTNGNLVVSNHRQGSTVNADQESNRAVRTSTVAKVETAVAKVETAPATPSVATTRGQAYDDIIGEHSRSHGVRADLVKAVMQVESAFNPFARSSKGALGLMQLMPAIIRQYSVQNPFDPTENVRGGVAYLRHLLDRYENNETLALAAYNAGPGAVEKYGQSVPPYRETRNYVAQINQMASRPVAMRNKSIYKVTDTVDGRPVVRYTDKKPTTGSVQLVGAR
jgi:soluble lytic murein transglycosylase-like protein